MTKEKHRTSQRIILPNGMWLLLYSDGAIKIAGYDRTIQVYEVLNRAGGAHVNHPGFRALLPSWGRDGAMPSRFDREKAVRFVRDRVGD